MFAKVFEQIFDSSIAEDYNCRRMFMDLLVLADSEGAVDMTHEAIARRTNVPVEEVVKYVKELCQPDAKSRSKLEEGKRLIPLDCNRDWGWKIVNYIHYRKIRDEAARREYFRDKQREHRKKVKKSVKDAVLTEDNKDGQMLTPASASSSVQKEGKDSKKGEFADRLAAIFGRRRLTPWGEKEVVAFNKLTFNDDEICMLERYYGSERNKPENICRRDLQTLLNNYAGEVDRARSWCERNPIKSKTVRFEPPIIKDTRTPEEIEEARKSVSNQMSSLRKQFKMPA